MSEDKSPDKESEKDEKEEKEVEAPAEGQAEKEQEKDQAPLDLPEKLQGKSVEDLAKMYVSLEKKMGEQSGELGDARKYLKERELLAQAVSRNPELYKMLENEISTLQGRPVTPQEEKKESGEAEKEIDPRLADLRRAEENRMIADFQGKFGIDKLSTEERKGLMEKVSAQFADLVDPGGKKPISQILSEVSLEQFPKFLENAYWIVNKDSLMDRGKLPDQDMASIGSMPTSSSGKSGQESGLTERERHIAGRLGVDPDKYLKSKRNILKNE
jgi:hypothetical protein